MAKIKHLRVQQRSVGLVRKLIVNRLVLGHVRIIGSGRYSFRSISLLFTTHRQQLIRLRDDFFSLGLNTDYFCDGFLTAFFVLDNG